jgi:hypothetical protein
MTPYGLIVGGEVQSRCSERSSEIERLKSSPVQSLRSAPLLSNESECALLCEHPFLSTWIVFSVLLGHSFDQTHASK